MKIEGIPQITCSWFCLCHAIIRSREISYPWIVRSLNRNIKSNDVCFLNGTLADLVKAIDCFSKLAVTVALPYAVFELISITTSLRDFWPTSSGSPKHQFKVHAKRQRPSSRVNIYISAHLFLPDHSRTIITLHDITLYSIGELISLYQNQLTHMHTRLYNAAASPASRLRSAGSLAIT